MFFQRGLAYSFIASSFEELYSNLPAKMVARQPKLARLPIRRKPIVLFLRPNLEIIGTYLNIKDHIHLCLNYCNTLTQVSLTILILYPLPLPLLSFSKLTFSSEIKPRTS